MSYLTYLSFDQLGNILEKLKLTPKQRLFTHKPVRVNTYGRYNQQQMGNLFIVLDHSNYFDEDGVRLK